MGNGVFEGDMGTSDGLIVDYPKAREARNVMPQSYCIQLRIDLNESSLISVIEIDDKHFHHTF